MAKSKSKTPLQPEKSGPQQALSPEERRKATQFKPGQSGNPAGKPKGTRNALSKAFIEDAAKIWREVRESDGKVRGLEALRKIADDEPAKFIKAVGDLVPREFDMGDKSQTAFRQLWTALATGKVPQAPVDDDGEEE